MKKTLGFIGFFLFLFGQLSAKDLTITTFNVRFYGQNSKSSTEAKKARRDQLIRSFLNTAVPESTVFAFQEILAVDRLQKNVLNDEYKCHSYGPKLKNHQHVAICHYKGYDFVPEDDDNNLLIDEVAMTGLRPAVIGVLVDANGKRLLHIVAVHLKAMPVGAKKRRLQIEMIANRLAQIDDDIPIVVLGDFNTFVKSGDVSMINNNFGPIGLQQMPLNEKNTYRTKRYNNKFDHLWVSSALLGRVKATVTGPCNPKAGSGRTNYQDLKFYNRFISDHCPVTATISLPDS